MLVTVLRKRINSWWRAGSDGFCASTGNNFCHEPRLRFARAAHDLGSAAAVSRGQNVCVPRVFLLRAAIRDDRLKSTAICGRDVQAVWESPE
jgi:hypothetical protein